MTNEKIRQKNRYCNGTSGICGKNNNDSGNAYVANAVSNTVSIIGEISPP